MIEFEIPKNAIIQSIEREFFQDGQQDDKKGLYIKTDKGDIKLLLRKYQTCCETYGYCFFDTPDNTDKFIGAKVLAVKEINIKLPEYFSFSLHDRRDFIRDMFTFQLSIVTDKGNMQYVVYNQYNKDAISPYKHHCPNNNYVDYYTRKHEGIYKVFDKIDTFTLGEHR